MGKNGVASFLGGAAPNLAQETDEPVQVMRSQVTNQGTRACQQESTTEI